MPLYRTAFRTPIAPEYAHAGFPEQLSAVTTTVPHPASVTGGALQKYQTVTKFNTLGQITEQTDANQRKTKYTYVQPGEQPAASYIAAIDKIKRIEYPDGKAVNYTYPASKVVSVDERTGVISEQELNGFGWVSASRTKKSDLTIIEETNYAYDLNGNVLTETTSRSVTGGTETVVRTHAYDAANRLLETTITKQGPGDTQPVPQPSPTGKIEYNLAGQKRSEIRKRQIAPNVWQDLITRYDYDPRGHMTRVTHPDGKFTESKFDAAGRLTNSIDRSGRVTEHKYDGAGRLQETIRPDKTSTFTHYDAAGRVDTRRDARGKITSYQRTPGQEKVIYPRLDNQPVSEPDQFVESLFDGAGNLTDSIDSKGNRTHYVVDALNRISEVWLYPAGGGASIMQRKTVYDLAVPTGTEYAGVVSATVEIDADQKKTFFGNDGLSRLKAVTIGYQSVKEATTVYSYDEAGNLKEQKDAEGRITNFEYDSLNRRTKRILPLLSGQTEEERFYEQFWYDDVGNLKQKRTFKNDILTYETDAVGRLLKRMHGQNLLAELKYRSDGQRASMKYPAGNDFQEVTYEYEADRLHKKITRQGPAVDNITTTVGAIEYDWDPAGNLTKLQVGTSHVVTYDWNARGQLDKVWVNGVSQPTQYTYNELGDLAEMLYPNQLKTVFGHNAQRHLTDVNVTRLGNPRASFNYNPSTPPDRSLALSGMRRAARETIGGASRDVDYDYDPLNRLTKEVIGSTQITYDTAPGYDNVGNRRKRTSSVSGVLAADASFDKHDRIEGFTFDNNGNLETAPGGATYHYSVENRLIQRIGGSQDQVDLAYDGDGTLVRKTVGGTGGSVTHFLVDDRNPTGYAQALQELNISLSPVRSYVYGHKLISQKDAAGTIRYYGYDGHGSVRFMVSDAGEITDKYTYDAFGIQISPEADAPNPNPYRYSCEYRDPDLRLVYLRDRWFIPEYGRFLTRDSFEGTGTDPKSLHSFAYCADPVNHIDPSGQMSMPSFTMAMGTWGFMAANLAYRAAPVLNRATVILFEAATGNTVFLGGAGGAVALRHGTKLGGVGWSTWQSIGNLLKGSVRKVGTKKELSQVLESGWQANHLNQAKAFPRIPYNDGVSVAMEAGTNVRGGMHWRFHDVIEAFWKTARDAGRKTVSNAEYNKVMREGLEAAGFPPAEVDALARLAEESRVGFKYFDGPGGLQPAVPNPIVGWPY